MEPAEGRYETEICRRSKLKTNPKEDQNGKCFAGWRWLWKPKWAETVTAEVGEEGEEGEEEQEAPSEAWGSTISDDNDKAIIWVNDDEIEATQRTQRTLPMI